MEYKKQPIDFWLMKPSDFNEWRASHDLPILFKYFKEILPEFNAWLNTLNITEREIYSTLNLGNFFNGNNNKFIIIEQDSDGINQRYCIDKSEISDSRWKNIDTELYKRKINTISEFTPYFKWIKNKTRIKKPVMWDTVNQSFTDEFFFGSIRGTFPNSRTNIWRGPELLKVGACKLPNDTNMGDRNLDFLDMDDIQISESTDSKMKIISYSSIRNLNITSTQQHFFKFKNCKFENTEIKESKIQDFHFLDCNIGELFISNTTIYKLSLTRCSILPFIEKCDLKDLIELIPKKNDATKEETFRLLKNAYNAAGQRRFSSEFFYLEQLAHRENLFNSSQYYKYSKDYPKKRGNSWLFIYKNYNEADRKIAIVNKLNYYIQYIRYPKYLKTFIKHKLQWLYSMLDFIIWGYGVKPERIIFSSSFIILLYAFIYKISSGVNFNGEMSSIFDYIYFSMITFTTLGYGDIYPKNTIMRMICGSEAFIGAFMIGLVVAGFSNKKAD